ncbi:hypothetical protein SPRG_19611 [Saprolegnia parasitica CBS 223.65]|uniref:Uncharacterized protein n=1 Tax=Saprolegnia parasitica (strain CBS 223.65) TaxID=695850 RepID=A0A067CPC4_SAPPC|nr:hypothetical protein SPRG_19611 [Saprolegnia parasitica CBS 223.65]KDO31090.1 hypothetical protein SPRG_19611 [Saprolegnia parasitica CBS 223.65]|eukprot:XP_012198342.1 hypothetical protein SPRG_19611 [Saprolegnia parasitica CBS 223.65]
MWHDYYRHCFALATTLRRYGIGHAEGGQAKVLYLLVGDPTSHILQHPVVLAGFLLDFWMSPDYVMRAILRVMQVADVPNFLIASLYLSRTVWFSLLPFRLGKERLCADVDPTLLAFVAVAVAGPLSYLQSQLRTLIHVYHYLCTATVRDATSIEMGVSALLYTIVMGCLPLTYGFAVARWRSRRRVQSSDSAKYLIHAHDVKHKWGLSLCLWPHRNVLEAGGSVHRLFAICPETKAVVGLSQTGTDCFIVYRTEPKTTHCVRVSLVTSTIDRRHLSNESKMTKKAAVGYVDLDAEPPVVYTGVNASPWVM